MITFCPAHFCPYDNLYQQEIVARAVSGLVSQFDEGLWQQWPLPSTEICFWHITAL